MDSGTIAALNDMQDMAQSASPQSHTPTPNVRGKKRRSAAVDAETDLRRREANRLAAERSRGRQHEKFVALEMAAQALGDENLRLKEAIRKHEQNGTSSNNESSRGANEYQTAQSIMQQSSTQGNAQNEQDQSDPTSMNRLAAEAAASVQAQQDSHSRTILAALMSGASLPGVDEAFNPSVGGDGDEASWIQGVENLFKEPEMSGRLGELAAIAAGRDGQAPAGASADGEASNPQQDTEGSRSIPTLASTAAAIAAAASATAKAIHDEMEKMLQDDLETTRATIEGINTQISTLLAGGADNSDYDLSDKLPENIMSTNPSSLRVREEIIQIAIDDTTKEIQVLREVGHRMREAKIEEEMKLSTVVGEVQALGMDGGDKERERVGVVLKALKNYVGFLLGGPDLDMSMTASSFIAPFSSPAIARRRRGRPPKHAPPPRLPYSTIYASSSTEQRPHDNERAGIEDHRPAQDTQSPSIPLQHRGSTSNRGRSKLGQSIILPSEEEVSQIQSHFQEASEADHEFLSHLAEHGSPSNQGVMDPSSFTDFLPAAAAAEAASASQGVQIDSSNMEAHGNGQNSESQDTVDHAMEMPNVLSRLKKGIPGSCDICGRTETSVWRKLALGGQNLKVCNPCGLYNSKFGVIRPPELWGDGKSVKKRRAGLRVSGSSNSQLQQGDSEDDSPVGKKRKRVVRKVEDGEDGVYDTSGDGTAGDFERFVGQLDTGLVVGGRRDESEEVVGQDTLQQIESDPLFDV